MTRIWLALTLFLPATGGGCARPSHGISLAQPSAHAVESHLRLHVKRAFYAPTGGGGVRLLIECPLPGADSGPTFCVFYCRLPGREGKFDIRREQGAGHGFLIQKTGEMRGLAVLSDGSVVLDRPAKNGRLSGSLAVRTVDGSTAHGTFAAAPSRHRLRSFEQAHAADIRNMTEQ